MYLKDLILDPLHLNDLMPEKSFKPIREVIVIQIAVM